MEANRKRKAFMKAKMVVAIYRAAKPSSNTVQYSSKVKPTPSSSFVVDEDNFSIPAPKPKLSDANSESFHDHSINGYMNNLYGAGGDENVDMRAASYISCVQERFRHEHADTDWRKYQETHSS
ncbi:uncharacterized protein LOC122059918 [Macadamia integrifolia]|uniref:uncharacterized protein LOC122059918 n=1 Tax=Macadamia integrifolia TaxID=60698 RepID=UPI001C52A160|nr:uncharacterized protein LOC122059918 [Macadamia integrifolia]